MGDQTAGQQGGALAAGATPTGKSGAWWMAVLFGGFFLLIAALVLYLRAGGPVPSAASADPALSALDPVDVRIACELSAKDQLKAPSTARFDRATVPGFTGTHWNYVGQVESQNSFGAMTRTRFDCQVKGSRKSDAVTHVNLY